MNASIVGLGTFPFPVSSTIGAGAKNIKGKLTLPNIIEGAIANSQVVVTVNLNGGSAFYTGIAGAEGFETGITAAVGDVINVILSSSAPAVRILHPPGPR